MRRRFNNSERRILFLRSEGKCEICTTPLLKGWHADHVIPFSIGGKTELSNAQALCSSCNLKKGNKSMKIPQTYKEREWQEECRIQLFEYWKHGGRDFLAEAYPGSGKTWFALRCAKDWLEYSGKGKIVVVAPTDNLREQWMKEAAVFGIALDNEFNGAYQLSPDYHGVVQTYATIANNPYVFQRLLSEGGIAILDEVHHAGDDKTWGDGIVQAFDTVRNMDFKLLALSGTPFRTDNALIPFVKYRAVGNGVHRSEPNYRYGYGRALSEGVVRHVIFPEYEGESTWMDEQGTKTVSFDDKVKRDESSKRLTTALMPSGDNEYICKLIEEANNKLMQIRSGHHKDAGGLIVAKDTYHANEIQKLLKSVTGHDSVVVTCRSNEEVIDANKKIDNFRKSTKPWIIAVKMVSEGVDIKRLRVGVYLSNVKTPLFLIQVIGRIIRVIEGIKMQEAYFYFPKDHDFVEVISDLQKVRDHEVAVLEDNELAGGELGLSETGGDQEPPMFVPMSTVYTGHVYDHDGDVFTPWEVENARKLSEQFGLDVDAVRLAAALRHTGGSIEKAPEPVPVNDRSIPVKDQHKKLAKEYGSLINSLCAIMTKNGDGFKELALSLPTLAYTGNRSLAHAATWKYAKERIGCYKKPKSMSLEELRSAIIWTKQEVAKWKQQ